MHLPFLCSIPWPRLTWAAIWLGCLLVPHGARAQELVDDGRAKRLLACLVKPPSEELKMPEFENASLRSSFVRVKMTFERADRRPDVEVIFERASREVQDLVTDYVKGYRLPCLEGRPVVAVQEFDFAPLDGRTIFESGATPASPRSNSKALAACLTGLVGDPDFPFLENETKSGSVILRAQFTAPDAPPTVTTAYRSSSRRFASTMEAHMKSMRLPCMQKGADPVTFQQQFSFFSQGEDRISIKPQSLREFLAKVKGIKDQKVKFDFSSMSCPFDFIYTVGLPAVANHISEVGSTDLNRTEFLSWIARLTLSIESNLFERLLGTRVLVSVPCGTIDLH